MKRVLAAVLAVFLLCGMPGALPAEAASEVQSPDWTFPAAALADTALPAGISTEATEWKYLDNNTDPGTAEDRHAWTRPDFDDSTWKAGRGSFGSKNGSKSDMSGGYTIYTLLQQYISGTHAEDIPAYFFRTEIEINDIDKVESLTGSIIYDDAVILYINGEKVAAFDEPDGGFPSNMSYGGSNADIPQEGTIEITDTSMLVEGVNTIAVELHNGRSSSSDIYMDFLALNVNKQLEFHASPDEQKVILNWTQQADNAIIALQISTDGRTFYGLSSEPVSSADAADGAYLSEEVSAGDTSIEVLGLQGGIEYHFKILIAVGDEPAKSMTVTAMPTGTAEPAGTIAIEEIAYSGGIVTINYSIQGQTGECDGILLGLNAFAVAETDTEDTPFTEQDVVYQAIFPYDSAVSRISFPMPLVTQNGIAGLDTAKNLLIRIGSEHFSAGSKLFTLPEDSNPDMPAQPVDFTASAGTEKAVLHWNSAAEGAKMAGLQISLDGVQWTPLSGAALTGSGALNGAYLNSSISAEATTVEVRGLTAGVTYFFKLTIDGGASTGEYTASAVPDRSNHNSDDNGASGGKDNSWGSLPSSGGGGMPMQTIPSASDTPAAAAPDSGTEAPSASDLPVFMPDAAKQEIVTLTPWAIPYITTLVQIGAVDGTADSFRPNDSVTRAEFVKMMVSTLDLELDYSSDSIFSDAKQGDWYTPYVIAGEQAGLVNGMGDGTFGAEQSISRQDIAAIIYRAAQGKMEKGDLSAFSDANSVAEYAAEGVGALYKAGIINGMEDGRFAPLENATRAEAAKMLAGFYMQLNEQVIQEDSAQTGIDVQG